MSLKIENKRLKKIIRLQKKMLKSYSSICTETTKTIRDLRIDLSINLARVAQNETN